MAAESLLRFDVPLDMNLLEQVVGTLYTGSSPDQVRRALRWPELRLPLLRLPFGAPRAEPTAARRACARAAQIKASQRVLSELQERISGEEAASALNWFRVDVILEAPGVSDQTKFYAMQVPSSRAPRRAIGPSRAHGPRPAARAPTAPRARLRPRASPTLAAPPLVAPSLARADP